MAENNYSNVIAPSDGVRRFLLKPSVIMLGLAAAVYCVFAFRMNAFEHHQLGGTLRSTLLYAGYVMVPLGILTAGFFARIRSMGNAFCMISLMIATLGAVLLSFNALSWLLHERGWSGILGGSLELLTFLLMLAVLVNLTGSCMEFRIVPSLGMLGAVLSGVTLFITGIRVASAYLSLRVAWDSAFDWNNLAGEVAEKGLQTSAKWVFRSIPLTAADDLRQMFTLRLMERGSVCFFYGVLILAFVNYYTEMKGFNRLISHASEYVDIPTARIAESLAKTERTITEKIKSGSSLKRRLKRLDEMARAQEQGVDITYMAEELERERLRDEASDDGNPRSSHEGFEEDSYDEEKRPRRRRREEDGYDEEERPRRRRREEDGYDEEERPRRRRREEDGFEEEERPRRRRREEDGFEEEERPRRRREEDGFEEEERPRRRREEDGYDEEDRPRRRRREEDGYDEEERPRRRRREEDGFEEEERPRRRKRRVDEEELTEEERYIMEERRKREARRDESQRKSRRTRSSEDDYRQRRRERLSRRESEEQREMNEYYNNYMEIRQQRNNNGNE